MADLFHFLKIFGCVAGLFIYAIATIECLCSRSRVVLGILMIVFGFSAAIFVFTK
jgi:hypothetical protein